MRPSPLRRGRPRAVIFALLCASVVAPVVFLSSRIADYTPNLAKKEFFDDVSDFVKNLSQKHPFDALRANSVEEEVGEGLKEPTRVVLPLTVSGGGELQQQNASNATLEKAIANEIIEETNGLSRPRPMTDEKVRAMEDMVIMARAYLLFAPPSGDVQILRELRMRIRAIERILGHTSKDSDLSRGALQKMRAMESTLAKANKAYPDCSAMASKLRAMTHNTEEQLRAQKNQASYLIQLAVRTLPKGLHCLSMRLTTDYFALQPQERQLPNGHKTCRPEFHHYAVFSDNVVACAVVLNSTISTSKEPERIVFHVVTDALNYPAMMMWFLMNQPDPATVHVQSLDDLKSLPSGFNSMFKQPGLHDPRYTSALNHLRFYLPEIFPTLDKILLLDHDVVVQRDLTVLWRLNMMGKVNLAVNTCKQGDTSHRLETLVDFSDPTINGSFDSKACVWAFGMNMFDLQEWRKQGLTKVYNKWLQMGKRKQPWKAGSLPLGQLVFYNHTLALDRRWHLLGLGLDSSVPKGELDRSAVIHFNGYMKPWLEIAIPKYRWYWTKFVDYRHPYLQRCNIHE